MTSNRFSHAMCFWVVALGLLWSTGAALAQRQSAREAIAAANKEFEQAYLRGDGATIGNQYARDAQIFINLQPIVRGREAIKQSWMEDFPALRGVTAKLETKEVQEAGDWAYEVGNFLLTTKDGMLVRDLKYLVIWKFEEGKWQLYRDIANENPPDNRAIRAAIEARGERYVAAVNNADAAALAALYTDDARILPPDADVVQGKTAIEQYWKKTLVPNAPKETDTMLDLQTYGDFALETGKYVQVDKDGKTTGEGKYLAVWRRDLGDWKIYCETWNAKEKPAQ